MIPPPRPGAETRAHKAARLVALVITVASGLAVLPLVVALVSTTSFLAQGADAAYGELITGWLLAALLAALWNIFFGLRAVAAPNWRRTTPARGAHHHPAADRLGLRLDSLKRLTAGSLSVVGRPLGPETAIENRSQLYCEPFSSCLTLDVTE